MVDPIAPEKPSPFGNKSFFVVNSITIA